MNSRWLLHPARLVPIGFLAVIIIGTLLLMLPAATAHGGSAPPVTALFTATSAVCVTGLVVVDTPTYWSSFGQAIILGLFQVGGFGIMTAATLLGFLVTGRLGLRTQLAAAAETRTLALGDVRKVLGRIAVLVVIVELLAMIVLTGRFRFGYDYAWGEALWHGLFHSVSAFNNAGFALYSDSVEGFATDGWISLVLIGAVMVGGIGFPVLLELRRRFRQPAKWSLHTKITLFGTAVLLTVGTLGYLIWEWSNPATAGRLDGGGKLLTALFQSAVSRTAGFNSLSMSEVRPETELMTVVLMFIGGGSAGTAGGIKVTTFFLLGFAIWAEARGEPDVSVFGRRLSSEVQRQALTIALLSVAGVVVGTLALLSMTNFPLHSVLFEATSAWATVGLSTGITGKLPPEGQLVITAMMFIGRVGVVTAASALALRTRRRLYRYPEERPIVG